MFLSLLARLKQGHHTQSFLSGDFIPPHDYLGEPIIQKATCGTCEKCIAKCPSSAIEKGKNTQSISIDLGKCIFCGKCSQICQDQVIFFSKNWKLFSRHRDDLIVAYQRPLPTLEPFSMEIREQFSHSCKFREVSAGGCNACETDSNVLTTIAWDISQYGYGFVASPRHADALWVTGAIPNNMQDALMEAWEATPTPKLLIAVGACAISGGLFAQSDQNAKGVVALLTPDLYIAGCPPHPATMIYALLCAMGRTK